jgi:hypothetical protein
MFIRRAAFAMPDPDRERAMKCEEFYAGDEMEDGQ